MKVHYLAPCLLFWLGTSPFAHAQESTDKNADLQAQIDRLTKQAELNKLTYGTPSEGKAGDVTGPENVKGLAQQRVLALSAATGQDLGRRIRAQAAAQACTNVLLTDDADHATKQVLALSIQQKLDAMGREIDKLDDLASKYNAKSRSGLVTSVGIITGIAQSLVSVWKLFQSNYAVSSFTTTRDADWTEANIRTGYLADKTTAAPALLSTRYPSFAQANANIKQLDDWLDSATRARDKIQQKTKDSKKPADVQARAYAEEVVKAITGMRTALVGADASVMAPIAALTPYLANQKAKGCTVRWKDNTPEGVAMTKDTLWGKRGRVYLNHAVQLSAIVLSDDGVPMSALCQQRSMSATIKLSALTKGDPDAAGGSWTGMERLSSPVDCGMFPAGTDANQGPAGNAQPPAVS
ncbi:hypothetical protein M8R20_32570 [Pseudomonas sp. R2.Fl]|nr:hypothetical protein [Pseudomonas sp. R2.Fl]